MMSSALSLTCSGAYLILLIRLRKSSFLPDGRIDILFTADDQEMITLHGLGLFAERTELVPFSTMFGASFKFLAAECLFNQFKPFGT